MEERFHFRLFSDINAQKTNANPSFAESLCFEGRRGMSTLQEQFVVDPKGRKTGVILPLARYRNLWKSCTTSQLSPNVETKNRFLLKN